jgi:hypothetical protein
VACNPDLEPSSADAGRSLCTCVAPSAHLHDVDHSTSVTMPSRSEYQPISQSVDEEEADVAEPVPSSSTGRSRRPSIPKKIDLGKLDNAFKRYLPRTTPRCRF